MSLHLLISILKIILIDVVLSGDNAVVIAMAAHRLPEHQRKRAIRWGAIIAIVLRILFTMIMSFLLMVPGLRLVGGLLLIWIACKLLRDEEEEEITPDNAARSTLAAIYMIFWADFLMSLDNMLAVAGASHGDWKLLLGGLVISIGIIMTCSNLIAQLMNRYHWIVTLGAAILAFTAGEMMSGDREVAHLFVSKFHVSLDRHWKEYMVSQEDVKDFRAEEPLPANLREVVTYEPKAPSFWTDWTAKLTGEAGPQGTVTFLGPMSDEQRDQLLTLTSDKEAINHLFDNTKPKWPAEDWRAIQGHEHHYVSWIFFGLVIAFCLTSPKWWPGAKKESKETNTPDAAPPAMPNQSSSS